MRWTIAFLLLSLVAAAPTPQGSSDSDSSSTGDPDDPDGATQKAYGPIRVHKLAVRPLTQGGGATRSSTNADSYALLANAIWWWDTTTYFPGIPKKMELAEVANSQYLLSLHIDFNNVTDAATADFNSLYDADLRTF
jgi:hypothetical protein